MIQQTIGPSPRRSRGQHRGIATLVLVGALMTLAGNAAAAEEPATGSADVMSNPGASWSIEPFAVFTPGTPLAAGHMRITFLGTSFLPRIAQEAIHVSEDAIALGQATVLEYAWSPPQTPYPSDQLAAPKVRLAHRAAQG